MRRKISCLFIIFFLLVSFLASFSLLVVPVHATTTYLSSDFETFPTGWTLGNSGTPPGNPLQSGEQKHAGTYSAVVNTTLANQYSYATKAFASNPAGDYHYSSWVYFPSSAQDSYMQLLGPYSSEYNFLLDVNYSGSAYHLVNCLNYYSFVWEDVCTVTANTWHQVESYWNNTSHKIHYYLDGSKQGGDWTPLSNTLPTTLYFGDLGTATWLGKVFYDDLLIDNAGETPADLTPPTFSGIATNSTEQSSVCNFTVTIADNVAVWKSIFSTNLTGSWANESAVVYANVSSTLANITKTLSVTVGDWGYQWYAEDNNTNNATTGIKIIMVGIIDYYSETHYDKDRTMLALHPAASTDISDAGQAFTSSGTTHNVSLAKFYLKKVGSPTGTAYAVLYTLTGVYGDTATPTGSPLATSDGFDVSTLTTSYQLVSFTFNSSQQYVMSATTHYGINFQNPTVGTIDGNDYPVIGISATDPDAPGNWFYYINPAWLSSGPLTAVCFYVYGSAANVTTTFLNAYGNIPLSFSFSSSRTFTLQRNGHIVESFSLAAQRIITFLKDGSIPLGFMATSARTISFSHSGNILLDFGIASSRAIGFSAYGHIPLTFGFSSESLIGRFLSFFGTINLNFGILTNAYPFSYIFASYTFTPTSPAPNELISFNASASKSSGAITGYSWDFGDGNVTAGGVTIDHAYSASGLHIYLCNLTISGAAGTASFVAPIIVGAQNGTGGGSIIFQPWEIKVPDRIDTNFWAKNLTIPVTVINNMNIPFTAKFKYALVNPAKETCNSGTATINAPIAGRDTFDIGLTTNNQTIGDYTVILDTEFMAQTRVYTVNFVPAFILGNLNSCLLIIFLVVAAIIIGIVALSRKKKITEVE